MYIYIHRVIYTSISIYIDTHIKLLMHMYIQLYIGYSLPSNSLYQGSY